VGGLVGDNEGTVTDAYWDRNTTGQETSAGSAVGLTTVEMTGLDGISNMDGFVFPDGDGPWHVTDSYPALAWQDTDPFYGVTIESTNTPVTEGETLAVTTTVTNWAGAGTQSITLTDTDFTNVEQDSAAVTLTSGNNTTVQLAWNTAAGDAKNGTVTVASENTIDTASVAIDAQPSSGGSGGSGSHRDPTVSVYSVAEPGDDTESEAVAKRKVVSMRNVGSGDVIPINLSATNDGTGNTTQGVPRNVLADGIDIRFKRGGDYNLVVSARDINVFDRAMDDPDAAATSDSLIDALDDDNRRFVGETNQQPVGFIEVEANFDSARNVQEATHKFRVRKSYLEATGASVDTVRLYRNGPDGWRSLPTRQTNEDETFYSFEADTPGFSVFIIGTNAPILESGTASLDSFNETTGAVAATVPVENLGSEPGVFKTTLTANGTVVATQEVTVGANETADVTVAVTLNTAGSVTLQLAGQSIGTVTRLSEEPLPPEDDNDSASGLGVSGIGFTLFVALGLLLSFIIWRRR
jgi:PGF-pre-PGF domain-containing protein